MYRRALPTVILSSLHAAVGHCGPEGPVTHLAGSSDQQLACLANLKDAVNKKGGQWNSAE